MPLLDRQIRLDDGRVLGVAEFGVADGAPLFYFHGFPGSRVEATLAEPAARELGLRVIAIDRPGFGRSDYLARRTIGDWPDDVAAVAERLGLERFAVVGVSGGGPYAAACAARLAPRLTAVGIVCGLGALDVPGACRGMLRLNRFVFFLSRRLPWLLSPIYSLVRAIAPRYPQRVRSE